MMLIVMIYIIELVFKVIITNFYVAFVKLLLCRVGWIEMMSLISSLQVIQSNRLCSNYINTNLKCYRLLLNVFLTNVVTKVIN